MTTTIHVMQQPYLQHSMWNGIKSSCLHDLHELSRLLHTCCGQLHLLLVGEAPPKLLISSDPLRPTREESD